MSPSDERRQAAQTAGGALSGLEMMRSADFWSIRNLVRERFWINLGEHKRELVTARVRDIMQELGFATFRQYARHLQEDQSGESIAEFVDRITTNHSFFFREKRLLDHFRDVALPETVSRIRNGYARDLRVWCAGCATGEEAYTLAMLELMHLEREYDLWHAGVLATDISSHALERAAAGVYDADRIREMPEAIRQRFMRETGEGLWEVVPKLRREITFRRFNLANPVFPFKRPFHIIFCRNVMIYFDQRTQEQLVHNFYRFTVPGGYLFTGSAESLLGRDCPYEYVSPSVYRRGDA